MVSVYFSFISSIAVTVELLFYFERKKIVFFSFWLLIFNCKANVNNQIIRKMKNKIYY